MSTRICNTDGSSIHFSNKNKQELFNNIEIGIKDACNIFYDLGLDLFSSCEGHNVPIQNYRHISFIVDEGDHKIRVLRFLLRLSKLMHTQFTISYDTSFDLSPYFKADMFRHTYVSPELVHIYLGEYGTHDYNLIYSDFLACLNTLISGNIFDLHPKLTGGSDAEIRI